MINGGNFETLNVRHVKKIFFLLCLKRQLILCEWLFLCYHVYTITISKHIFTIIKNSQIVKETNISHGEHKKDNQVSRQNKLIHDVIICES